MTTSRVRAWFVPSLFIGLLLAPALAIAEVPAPAIADQELRPDVVAAFGEASHDERVAAPRPSSRGSAEMRARSGDPEKNDLLHRAPKRRQSPLWPRQWAYSVALFVALACGILAFAFRELRSSFQSRSPDLLPGFAVFFIALVLRLAIPIGPTNWHTHLFGVGTVENFARFGPGTWVLQAGLWSLFSPSDVVLGRAHAVIGALSVPLLYAILRARKTSIAIATSVAIFWALSPVHIRISASFSEHVVSSTLSLLLLLVALRGGSFGVALSALLIPAIALCRFDAWPQLAMVPLWIVFGNLAEEQRGFRSRIWAATPYFAIWAVAGLIIQRAFFSGGLSHPPPAISEVLGELFGLGRFLIHYFGAANTYPFWFSPVAAWLMIPGAYWMFKKRRLLLVTLIWTLLVSFVPLGRSPGELVTARYFLPALALLLIPAGHGLEWLLARTKLQNPWPFRGLAYVAAFAMALPSIGYRYGFQDEYDFLRSELATLSPDCTIVTLPVRHPSMPRDIDCCMALPYSPLALVFPGMKLIELEDRDLRFDDLETECVVYYENPICHLDPASDWEGIWDETRETFNERCSGIVETNRLERIAHSEFSNEQIDPRPLFRDRAPQGTIYRVMKAADDISELGEARD